MSETLLTYRKTVKLRADSLEESRPIRAALDEHVHQTVSGLAAHQPELRATRSSDDRGNYSIHASASGYDIVVTTRSGQDSVFQGGERRTFISYTLSASSSLRSLNRAATISQEMSFALRGIGALLFAGLFFWGIDMLLSGSGITFIRLPVVFVVGVVLAGGWLGERIGNLLGAKLEARAWSHAERAGSLPQLESLWTRLEQQFNALLNSYEHV